MRKTASLTALAVTAGTLGFSASAAFAAPTGIVGASLTWKVHECAFSGAFVTTANSATDSCKSIREDQATTGNVSKVADGWQFSNGTGKYDSANGATTLNFTGSVRLGNTSQGNYYIELTDPTVSVDSAGDGSLTARVVVKSPGSAPATDRGRVEIVDLPSVPNATTWSVTPPWAGVGAPDSTAPLDGKQFAPAFVDLLDASMRNWFRASSSAEATVSRSEYNSLKTPSPVAINFTQAAWTPALQITNAENLQPGETRTIGVHGTGFDPGKQGGAVAGMYVVFGPNPAATTNGYTDPNMYGAAAYLPAGPNSNGEFSTTLTITGNYTDSNGQAWSPASTTLGVSVWAAHTRQTTAWDAFTPMSFATPAPTPQPATPAKKPRKVKAAKVSKVSGNKVTVKWTKPAGASSFKVRLSKRNKAGKFNSWVTVTGNKAVLKGVKKRGTYRVQIRAINEAGASQTVTLKLVR